VSAVPLSVEPIEVLATTLATLAATDGGARVMARELAATDVYVTG
jgi:hypothetical protein